jgi:hypothetical protein
VVAVAALGWVGAVGNCRVVHKMQPIETLVGRILTQLLPYAVTCLASPYFACLCSVSHTYMWQCVCAGRWL